MNPLKALHEQGQSIWLDYIQRSLLQSGELNRMIVEDGLCGVTSNPSIFEKAITGSHDYDEALKRLVSEQPDRSSEELFYALAIEDIQGAADAFRPVYETSRARDGYVSLEVSPDLAYDSDATVREAQALFARVDRPNLMIKVPATREGLVAIEALIAAGINVNATLLFSVERYKGVAEAYLRGLERRAQQGLSVAGIASVASFFVSRVDSSLDRQLETLVEQGGAQAAAARDVMGTLAVANAKLAYRWYQQLFASPRFAALAESGAQPQRLLWASTGTKNPSYSDVLYVETLIGPDTVNTLPPATLQAFRDHGTARATLAEGVEEAARAIDSLDGLGIDLTTTTDELERDGVRLFAESFHNLLAVIADKAAACRDPDRASG